MAVPTLTPSSQISAVKLPSTGSSGTDTDGAGTVTHYPFGIYVDSGSPLYDTNFVSGASDQVAYTFKKLGGDVLDIELTLGNIYSAYEEATLEYSYIVNIHQSKNILHSSLGETTGAFDHDGHLSGSEQLPLGSQPPSNVGLRFPKFKFAYARRVMDRASTNAGGIGGTNTIYSASIALTASQQDYDLQKIVQDASSNTDNAFYAKVNNKRISIKRVFYKTPHAMWRFYGYYGGLNTIGNMSTYGMYADDSTFEIIPPWQNKLQAMAYEDAIYTRNSHYSYQIRNNKIKIHPAPLSVSPEKFWFEFIVDEDIWDDPDEGKDGIEGVNNMNTLPLTNIPYKSINSIGKQWIRRFALALAKETLGQIRSKFGAIPIPGNNVTLNGTALVAEGKAEQKELREELQKVLDELTYQKMVEIQNKISKDTSEITKNFPYLIYTG